MAKRCRSARDQALTVAFSHISEMAVRINLSKSVVDRANNIFKMVHDGGHVRGRTNYAMASASLYIACRQDGDPRTFNEICAVSKVPKKEMGRCFKHILRSLGTSVDLITTGDFISRFCSTLKLPIMIQGAATTIGRKAIELDILPGRSPVSVAAAAIYMASQGSEVKRSLKEIGDVVGVGYLTIRDSYKLLYLRAEELFPADFVFATSIDQLPSS